MAVTLLREWSRCGGLYGRCVGSGACCAAVLERVAVDLGRVAVGSGSGAGCGGDLGRVLAGFGGARCQCGTHAGSCCAVCVIVDPSLRIWMDWIPPLGFCKRMSTAPKVALGWCWGCCGV